VPRMMAMRYSVSLPRAAAEALSAGNQPRAHTSTIREDTHDPGGQRLGDFENPISRQAGEQGAIDRDTDTLEFQSHGSPVQAAQQQQQQQPPLPEGSGSQAQPWRAKLSNGLERLRLLTTSSRPVSRPATPEETGHHSGHPHPLAMQARAEASPRLASASLVSTNLQFLTSTAARYVPVFVHIGTQHLLHAPPGALPLSPVAEQPARQGPGASAPLPPVPSHNTDSLGEHVLPRPPEGAGTNAVSEDGPFGHAAADGSQSGSGHSLPAAPDSRTAAEAAAIRRVFLDRLTYHRMFTLRERAAAVCAALLEPILLGGGSGGMGCSVRVSVSDDVAPPLHVRSAAGLVSPLRPAAHEAAHADGPRCARPATVLFPGEGNEPLNTFS
jgi:hypothetical protein